MCERAYLELSQAGISYQLWRLTIDEYIHFKENSFPIQEDFGFYLNFYKQSHEIFNLAKIYASLEHIFGNSSSYFDSWKGSFSFPLLLKVKGDFFYLLDLYDHRGTLRFKLYKIVDNAGDKFELDIERNPDENEFSQREINEFCSYFYGFLQGYSKSLSRLSISPFLKQIRSNLILYGYENDRFFEEYYDSEAAYQEAIAAFENIHGTDYKVTDMRTLLEKIAS